MTGDTASCLPRGTSAHRLVVNSCTASMFRGSSRITRAGFPESDLRASIVRPVTEIPEHLLKRSQARKAAGGDAAAASAPATTPATTPAAGDSAVPAVAAPKAPAVPAGPPPPKPDIPVVAAYKARKKIPVWAMVTLSILPLWVFMYVLALQPQPRHRRRPAGRRRRGVRAQLRRLPRRRRRRRRRRCLRVHRWRRRC